MSDRANSAIKSPLNRSAERRWRSARVLFPRHNRAAIAALLLTLLCLTSVLVSADSDVQQPQPAGRVVNNIDFGRDVDVGALLARLQDAPRLIQLSGVNLYFNGFGYRSDLELWKRSDHWATPMEFLALGAGDCEDFAIAKYFALRALGVPDDQMFIAYVYDLSINSSHMILVYRRPEAPDLVLDNRTSLILSLSEHKDLVPVYGFNATGAFLLPVSAKSRSREHRPISYFHPQWADILSKVPSGKPSGPRAVAPFPADLKAPGGY